MPTTTRFEGFKAGPFSGAFASLYDQVSTDPLPHTLQGVPQGLEPFVLTMYRGAMPRMVARQDAKPGLMLPNNGGALVGYSGGKDSLAAALRLRAQGFKVRLLFIKGINKSYPGEEQAAAATARAAGFHLYGVKVVQSGKMDYIENPMKNQFIMAIMADFALRAGNGWAVHAQGGLSCDVVATQAFGSGFSDALEMFAAAGEFFARQVRGYSFKAGLLANDTDSILTILDSDPGLFMHLQSCMLPLRYKPTTRRANERKFGAALLLPGRCGSCYKCAAEYLHLASFGMLPKHAGYAAHCIGVMQKALEAKITTGKRYSREEAVAEFVDGKRVDYRWALG